jgi:rfaE bifunctional protein kinase chain/domain
MDQQRLRQITGRYGELRVAVLGDFCLDRYLEIDPARQETSIETGLPVYNVAAIRAQPGAAGTVLNNLAALGIGALLPVGFAGDDGEGFELRRALERLSGVRMDGFQSTPLRRTFTYCKPLVVEGNLPPRELNRLDIKNWTPTPAEVQVQLATALEELAGEIDALIIMDQVEIAETGAVTQRVLETVGRIARRRPSLRILADSRRGLAGFPPVSLKMNRAELGLLLGGAPPDGIEAVGDAARRLAQRHGQDVFITLAERGLLAASADGRTAHFEAFAVRGPIDVVGAGDAVAANLAAALAAGAALEEAAELANIAASVVVHQLGTTGTATVAQIAELLAKR